MTSVLTSSPQSGIYRVKPSPTLERDLATRGWAVGSLDVETVRGFVAGIGEALAFPDYYGRNLDAMADCLSDLTRPTAVVWRGWGDAAAGDPERWARLFDVLSEAMARRVPFAVVLAEP